MMRMSENMTSSKIQLSYSLAAVLGIGKSKMVPKGRLVGNMT